MFLNSLIVAVIATALVGTAAWLATTPVSGAPRSYTGRHIDARQSIAPAAAGIEHEGATEAFRDELRSLRSMPCAPELERTVTTAEMLVLVHDELGEVLAELRAGLDTVCDPVCTRLDPMWWRVDEPTRAWPLVSTR